MYSNVYFYNKNILTQSSYDVEYLCTKIKNDIYNVELSEIYALLKVCINDKEYKNKIISIVSEQRFEMHRNIIHAIIPQYHTSKCIDNCSYCSFRKNNKQVLRVELNDEDFEKELRLILDWGYTIIEFVYSTDTNFPAKRIAERIIYAKEIGKSYGTNLEIGVNAPTLSLADYKLLNSAGIDFILLWMETYSDKYKEWHPGNTPKSNFTYRIDTFDRSIQAGINKYAFAILFGLSDWFDDIIALCNHGLYLRKTYGIEPYIIGNPRLKYAMGLSVENSKYIIDDENYIFICYFLKLIFPTTKLFINTRESIDINIQLIKGGGDFFTIDCGTFPGAYLNNEIIKMGQEQFHTSYYNREKTIKILREKGFEIIF